MSNALRDRLLKNTTVKEAAVMQETKFFSEKDNVPVSVPALNIALSGTLSNGFSSGLGQICGPSKHFKSSIMLLLVSAYQKQYEDSIILFYDTEFGSPPAYFKSFGIDLNRVIHIPITDIEKLKFELMNQVSTIGRKDKVMIIVDSIGNVASKKEVEDALDQKAAADMTRAKQLKSLFRMITPHLTINDIPMIVVNHTYDTQEMHSKKVVSGGCLVAGTELRMADGTVKSIELIQVGDMVQTLIGDKEVTATWNPDTLLIGEPECYEIEFEDGSSVTCSNNHPFLIDGKWVVADDIVVGMGVTTL